MIKNKISELVSKMTLTEKLGQLNQLGESIYGSVDESGFEQMIADGKVGSLILLRDVKRVNELQHIAVERSRLGIPLLFAADIIHGIRTIFPTPLAESCGWNPETARKTAEIAAFEGSALGYKWTYAPMVDIVRDSRWGRVMESFGEDQYLTSLFAAAKVKGFQGSGGIDKFHMASCAKHFTAYGAVEAGKDYNTVQLSESNMNNVYLKPFKACVDSGVASLMTAFNDINGVPCSVNGNLLNEILRKGWGFKGVVVSDYNSLGETINHGYCYDRTDAAYEGINNGLTVDMCSEIYINEVSALIDSGKLKTEQIDKLVYEMLLLKDKLGLFENPYADEYRASKDIMDKSALDIALESAQESIVLLKNNGVLPLKKQKVLLVGSLADERVELHGNWASAETASRTNTLFEEFSKVYDITYIKTYDNSRIFKEDIDRIKGAVKSFDAIIAVAGESFVESGEAASKTDISLNKTHSEALNKLAEFGVPVITLLINGRPLVIGDDVISNSSAIIECWQLGTTMAKAVANVVTGKYNPQGRLTMSFPRATGQCPVYYSHFSTGRPHVETDKFTSKYIDCADGPVYPFGYGLSYSNFVYSNLSVNGVQFNSEQEIKVSISVKNTGSMAGIETVQLYIRAHTSKPVRPVKELLKFEKIRLSSGEIRKTEFTIMPAELGTIINSSLEKTFQKGKYDLYVGSNSNSGEKVVVELI